MCAKKEMFLTVLVDQYTQLFELPEYAMAAKRNTPTEMAGKMVVGLLNNSADKDGVGVKRTCKALGLKCTYKAITEFLKS